MKYKCRCKDRTGVSHANDCVVNKTWVLCKATLSLNINVYWWVNKFSWKQGIMMDLEETVKLLSTAPQKFSEY